MTHPTDHEARILEQVRAAIASKSPLRIVGGGSKAFLGRTTPGEVLDIRHHGGVVSYAPSELVITARAGTSLLEIEALLAEHGQMLPFEPPHFQALHIGPALPGEHRSTTFGGMIAAGLSGPRRPWAGAVRDAVLGVKVLNGRGEVLNFGGQVMKNVAGYDVARLMAGAQGTLGVILEASVKVLPRPPVELTLGQQASPAEAARRLIEWGRLPLPVSASLHQGDQLWLRLSGSEQGVAAARARIGGEVLDNRIWPQVRDHDLPFFQHEGPLWRIAVPAAAPAVNLGPNEVSEWGGALRWLRTDSQAETIRHRARQLGGHATLFRGAAEAEFQPLPPQLLALHRRIKAAFDPLALFNPGRLYPDL